MVRSFYMKSCALCPRPAQEHDIVCAPCATKLDTLPDELSEDEWYQLLDVALAGYTKGGE